MKSLYRTVIQVEVTHEKPIPDLVDLVAGRAYTLDGACNATATLISNAEVIKPTPEVHSDPKLEL